MIEGTTKALVIALGAVFATIPIVGASLRFYARHLIRARCAPDDFLVIPAALSAFASAICLLIIGACVSELDRHHRQVKDANGNFHHDHGLIIYEKCRVAIQICSVTAVGLSKLSVVVLFGRIFSARQWFRFTVYGFTALLASWTVAFFFALLLQCIPISIFWTRFEWEYKPYCVDSISLYYAYTVTDAITDCFVWILPLPILWHLQLPNKQKIAVAGMFLLGATIIAISWTRLAIFFSVGHALQLHPYDYVYYNTSAIYWSVIESSLSVLCACLPVLRPIFNPKAVRARSNRHTNTYLSEPESPAVPGWRRLSRKFEIPEEDSVHSGTKLGMQDALIGVGVNGLFDGRRSMGDEIENRTGCPRMGVDTKVEAIPLHDIVHEQVRRPDGIWVRSEVVRSESQRRIGDCPVGIAV